MFDRIEGTVELAQWLVSQGLGPMAHARFRERWPELAALLQTDFFSAVAEFGLHQDSLALIRASFQADNIPMVLLKGASLSANVYGYPAWRTMSDIDIWLQAPDVGLASRLMQQNGFSMYDKGERPLELQLLSGGEIRFYRQGWQQGLVELHWKPVSGWWLIRTAAVDSTAIWSRKEQLVQRWPLVYQLAVEDMIIQLAIHLSVNHQLGMAAVRGLVDIVMTARTRPVNWAIVVERATEWRVGTATWLVLNLANHLMGCSGADLAVERMRPSRLRRLLLRRFVTPETVLAGTDLRSGRSRYILLLLLVDRLGDMARLLFRTAWPEKEWLAARYRGQGNRWRHLWNIVRFGQI